MRRALVETQTTAARSARARLSRVPFAWRIRDIDQNATAQLFKRVKSADNMLTSGNYVSRGK